MRRVIQGELVSQAPGENAKAQKHQSESEHTNTASGPDSQYFDGWADVWVLHCGCFDDAIALDGCKAAPVSEKRATQAFMAFYNHFMQSAELARLLDAELRGDPDLDIVGVAGIEEAGPGHLTFVANPKYAGLARTTRAAVILVTPDFPDVAATTLRLKNPYLAFARAVDLFYEAPPWPAGIHSTAVIASSAKIGANPRIGAFCVIGENVVIGDDVTLLPHVVLYPGVRVGHRLFAHAHAVVREHCQLGDDVVLQNGVIVGSDGFGFAKDETGSWHKIPQSGPTLIGDRVEIQANACIDRASVGATRIGDGVKIDNLVQVGHGSSVQDNTLLCAQVGLAGSTHVGKNVILAGQVGVAGHCTIGDGVIAIAQAGLHGDIPENSMVAGSPAFDHKQWLRASALFSRLPDLLRQFQRKPKPGE